jgi:abortive infection bacteriophage resistance protein
MIPSYSLGYLPEEWLLYARTARSLQEDNERLYSDISCEIYEKGDENTDLVYIDEMLQTLKLSLLYSQMSKKDQRDLTAKKFNEKVEKTSSCGSIIRHVVGVLMGNNEERRAHLGSENFR